MLIPTETKSRQIILTIMISAVLKTGCAKKGCALRPVHVRLFKTEKKNARSRCHYRCHVTAEWRLDAKPEAGLKQTGLRHGGLLMNNCRNVTPLRFVVLPVFELTSL